MTIPATNCWGEKKSDWIYIQNNKSSWLVTSLHFRARALSLAFFLSTFSPSPLLPSSLLYRFCCLWLPALPLCRCSMPVHVYVYVCGVILVLDAVRGQSMRSRCAALDAARCRRARVRQRITGDFNWVSAFAETVIYKTQMSRNLVCPQRSFLGGPDGPLSSQPNFSFRLGPKGERTTPSRLIIKV